jgi:hypothetical protein
MESSAHEVEQRALYESISIPGTHEPRRGTVHEIDLQATTDHHRLRAAFQQHQIVLVDILANDERRLIFPAVHGFAFHREPNWDDWQSEQIGSLAGRSIAANCRRAPSRISSMARWIGSARC